MSPVVELLNEPRNRRHMPLSSSIFSLEEAVAWVEAKDAQWAVHGYGPWAVLVDGSFAGWGGFQREENGVEFALVLTPEHWGHGREITRAALDRGFDELGLESVLIALPFSRSSDRAVGRFGFVPDGTVVHGGSTFRQYRLTRDGWRRARGTERT
jgi:RimJ/RimL family protein N-acetyltransferase